MRKARVEELAEVITVRYQLEQKPVLLIGAGCSVTAKIPAANEMVTRIRELMPATFSTATGPTYAEVMEAMHEGIRRDLIALFVQAAEVNTAHSSIAKMVKANLIDSIFTTNFDPLLKVACNAVSARTVSLDMTLPSQVMPQGTTETPIYFLHGRHTSRVLLMTKAGFEARLKEFTDNTGHLFRNAGRRGPWIVCGYSGENDPLLEVITRTKHYEYGLYWVLYEDAKVPPRVREIEGLRIVEGHDADSFFSTLAKALQPLASDVTKMSNAWKLGLLKKEPE